MKELITDTPDSLPSFRQWVRRAAEEISPRIEANSLGEFDLELHALIAGVIRRAKAHAYRLGLYDLADRLPERKYKTCLDGLLRLRECAEWRQVPPAASDGQAMTVRQAAVALGISERLARDLIANGELPHHRVGSGRGRVRIRARDLEAYQNRRQAGFSHLFR